jgi:3'-5' exoribonuclease
MKTFYTKDLKFGMSIFSETFCVKSFRRANTKDNKPYIDIELTDKTGSIKGKVWQDSIDKIEAVNEGDVVIVDANIESFKDNLQLRVLKLKKTDEYDSADLLSVSEFDLETMFLELQDEIAKIKNKNLVKLLNNIFTKDFSEKFKKSSAAYRVHHSYQGGLLEHTVEMLRFVDPIVKSYPKINADILRTGVILHDTGKVQEFATTSTTTITTEGKLLGHIFMGAELVKHSAPKDMPETLLNEILHVILSHHGELEFGSPIKPKTAEAIALSMLDNVSSKINSAYTTIHADEGDSEFTGYHKQLGTELYRSPYLNPLINEDLPF